MEPHRAPGASSAPSAGSYTTVAPTTNTCSTSHPSAISAIPREGQRPANAAPIAGTSYIRPAPQRHIDAHEIAHGLPFRCPSGNRWISCRQNRSHSTLMASPGRTLSPWHVTAATMPDRAGVAKNRYHFEKGKHIPANSDISNDTSAWHHTCSSAGRVRHEHL